MQSANIDRDEFFCFTLLRKIARRMMLAVGVFSGLMIIVYLVSLEYYCPHGALYDCHTGEEVTSAKGVYSYSNSTYGCSSDIAKCSTVKYTPSIRINSGILYYVLYLLAAIVLYILCIDPQRHVDHDARDEEVAQGFTYPAQNSYPAYTNTLERSSFISTKIKEVPALTYIPTLSSLEPTLCARCFEKVNAPDYILFKCEHYFHIKCCGEWSNSHTNCPICST